MRTSLFTNSRKIATLLLLTGSISAIAAPLKLDTNKSNVIIQFKQMNVPVDAKFKKFTAAIDYDAAKPETSKAAVEIDVASFDLGDPEYNKEVTKKEWFNAPQFPKASFISTSMKVGANGSLVATGNLTIKGKTTAITFPLSVKKENSNIVFDGSLPIKRLTFNIGEGEWKDTGMVADEVIIKFHVVSAP